MEGLTFSGFIACIVLCSTICGIASFLAGRKKSVQDDGEKEGNIETDIQYIKESIKDTAKSIETLTLKMETSDNKREEDYRALLVQLTELKSGYKSLYIRVDNIEKNINSCRNV